MSYVKNEWKRGDIVTAEKLNHMEDGIVGVGGGAMVATFTVSEDETVVTSHTVEQVSSAMKSGIVYAVLQQVRDGETVFVCSGVMEQILFDDREEPVYDDGSPCLMTNTVGEDDGSRVFYKYPMVAVSNGEWIAGL